MKQKVNCYSGGESRMMDWSQQWRGEALRPFLRFLSNLGFRANHVTLLSLLTGLAFVPSLLTGNPVIALALLTLHVLLDGLDGPLARFRGQASNRGSFTDTMADQLVVTATTLAVIQTGQLNLFAGGLYIFLYAIVVGFAMVRNALSTPYSWLFRPRFVVFIWFAVEWYIWPGSLNYVIWITSAVLALKAVTGFAKIRRHM